MKTLTKTLTGAAVAGAAALGVVATVTTETEKPAEYVDNIKPVAVRKYEVRKFAVSRPEVRKFTVGKIEVSKPEVAKITVSTPEIVRTVVRKADVDLPEVRSYRELIERGVALQHVQRTLFRDQRNLQYDPGIGLDSATWEKWIKIYQSSEYTDYKMAYVELEKGLRIICEVKCPTGPEQRRMLGERLKHYRKRGYNAVLLSFTLGERLEELEDVAEELRDGGWKIVIAYSGRESLREPLFKEPERLAKFLSSLGARADALLLGWGRTSLHLFLPDKQWTNYLVRNARKFNPELAVVGMAYYGETAEQLEGVTYDVPENCSAVLIVGLGYPRASTKTVFRKVFPEVLDHPHKIGLVVGERPYYDTLHRTGKTQAQNEAIKRRIEIRLKQAGCDSTMTYSGDGSDGQYGRKDKNENLCEPVAE